MLSSRKAAENKAGQQHVFLSKLELEGLLAKEQLGFNRLESVKLARCIEETVENASRFIWNRKDVA